jgi:hypothetical protein
MNVCVVIWRDETLVPDVNLVSEILERLSQEESQGIGLVQFIDEGCKTPSAEARAAIAKLLDRGRSYIRCSTIVFVGEGFRAAAIRAIITGVSWIARPGFPHQVFVDIPAAARLQASHLAPQGSEGKWAQFLTEVVTRARRTSTSNEATVRESSAART